MTDKYITLWTHLQLYEGLVTQWSDCSHAAANKTKSFTNDKHPLVIKPVASKISQMATSYLSPSEPLLSEKTAVIWKIPLLQSLNIYCDANGPYNCVRTSVFDSVYPLLLFLLFFLILLRLFFLFYFICLC